MCSHKLSVASNTRQTETFQQPDSAVVKFTINLSCEVWPFIRYALSLGVNSRHSKTIRLYQQQLIRL